MGKKTSYPRILPRTGSDIGSYLRKDMNCLATRSHVTLSGPGVEATGINARVSSSYERSDVVRTEEARY